MKISRSVRFTIPALGALWLLATWLLADTTVPANTNVPSGQTLQVTDPGQVTNSGAVTVQSGAEAGFAGGTSVKLEPGFHAFSGSVFHASIDLNLGALSSLADTDGDGLPDAWEMRYFGNLTTANATTDSDGDGVSDLAEYRAGTNPLVNENTAGMPTGVQVVVRLPTGHYQGITSAWAIVSAP